MSFNTEKFVKPSGDLFFDFVNTVIARDGEDVDLIETESDFFSWAVSVGICDEERAAELMAAAGKGGGFLDTACRLRNALRGIAFDLIGGMPVSGGAILQINKFLKVPFGYGELDMTTGKPELRFVIVLETPESILAPVAADAARLLTEGDPALVKQCESDTCVLFFYDSTKNHSRRWCSMESCGNREKVKAFYERKKKGRKKG